MPPLNLFGRFFWKNYEADHIQTNTHTKSITKTTFRPFVELFTVIFVPLNEEMELLEESVHLRGRHFGFNSDVMSCFFF